MRSAALLVAGLPTGHPVIGSVNDGVEVPYSLNLQGRTSARVLLKIDDQVVADVSNAPASGTLRVPARSPLLSFDDNAQLSVVAKAPDGTVLDSATGVGSVSDGARLPAAFSSYWPQLDLADGDRREVNVGQNLRFLGSVSSGSDTIPLTSYDLKVDGVSILATPPKDCASDSCDGTQWIDGSWTAPMTPGDHQLVLSASATGDSRVIRKTYTLAVQPPGSFRIDALSVVVDPGVGYHLTTLLRRDADYAPVPRAPLVVWRSDDAGATWTKVLDAATDDTGTYDTVLRPLTSCHYKLSTPGVSGVVGPVESSIVHVEVKAEIRLTASVSSVTLPSEADWSTPDGVRRRTITFQLAAPSGMSGSSGLLQLWNGQTWNSVAWSKIGTDGTLALTYVLGPKKGDYTFGALSGRNATYAPTVSNDVHVTVR